MPRQCYLEHDTPAAATHTFELATEGHEHRPDVPLCRDHGQAMYDHDRGEFCKEGNVDRLAELTPYVEDRNSVVDYHRIPPDRESRHIDRSIGLNRDDPYFGRLPDRLLVRSYAR